MAGYIPLDSGRTEGGPGDAAPAGLPFSSPAPFPVLRVLAKGESPREAESPPPLAPHWRGGSRTCPGGFRKIIPLPPPAPPCRTMLRDRLKVAIPLLCVVFAAFFLPGFWGHLAFAALSAAMLFTGNHEGVLLWGFSPWGKEELLLDAFAVALIANAWGQWNLGSALLLAFLLLAFLLHFPREVKRSSLEGVSGLVLLGLLVCWSLSFLAQIFYGEAQGPMLMAYLVVVTKIADIGAYLFGSLTAKLPRGNHKLSPHVSPKKSWEGLGGGILFSVLASLAFLHFQPGLLPGGLPGGALFGAMAATLGLAGDLCESLLKRAAGAKDSGKVPGLGGVLDMMDSLLPMGVVLHLYLQLLK